MAFTKILPIIFDKLVFGCSHNWILIVLNLIIVVSYELSFILFKGIWFYSTPAKMNELSKLAPDFVQILVFMFFET